MSHQTVRGRTGSRVVLGCALLIGTALVVSGASGQRYSDFITPAPLPPGSTLVIGFQGGRQAWDSETEGIRLLVLRLRERELPGVYIETVENRRRKLALRLIRAAFDRNQDGELDNEERDGARLILFGQSFGGAAVVKLARELNKREIPVLLTVQIDSIGIGDDRIPPNVRRAANLHQQDGRLIRGETPIVAEDPERTEIIGEFQFSYKDKKVSLSGVPWHKKIFRIDHSRMNRDPAVWSKVESLILSEVSGQPGLLNQ